MLREYLKSIADAIRTKLGSTDTINAQNFPSKVNEVYDKGRTDEWSDFWDVFQQNGTRTNYNYAFHQDVGNPGTEQIWTDKTFKPKYDFKLTSANRAFLGLSVTDFVKCLVDMGIEFDTSQCTNTNSIFSKNSTWRLPTLDLSVSTSISGLVANCYKLEKIEKIIWGEKISPNSTTNAFSGCPFLAEFESEGTLAVSVSFASCPLTVETIKGLILCLKNYAGTSNAGAYTLTLNDECKTAMTNLGAIPEFNNKTYDEYLADIGWRLE